MKHECGVFGVYGCPDAAKLCYLGLYAQQHRGQESAGIVSLDNSSFHVVKKMGLVSEVFTEKKLGYLKGKHAIGHVRYSTTGSSNPNNIQPLYSKTSKGKFAVAHNGNLTNGFTLYNKLKKNGALFQSSVDSEVILHLISTSKSREVTKVLQDTLAQLEGAYSLVGLGENFIVAARDPYGFRPLAMGRLKEGYVFASETCAFDLIGAKYERDVEPGEIVIVSQNKVKSYRIPVKEAAPSFCIFEHIYFARPDSIINKQNVHPLRKEFGRVLAREHPVEADIVMAIPDSGNIAALGYAEESGIPFEFGMTRNHYVGRTFIQPTQKIRNFGVKVKLNVIPDILKGKRVVVVDDSIVRGTTSKERVSAIRKAGAKEVHVRISSPPVVAPCHFGIDTPSSDQLIASQKTAEEICEFLGADSLGYLSIKGMLEAAKSSDGTGFCTGCFTGKYPCKVRNKGKHSMESSKRIKEYGQKR